jgi:hypothetical protein
MRNARGIRDRRRALKSVSKGSPASMARIHCGACAAVTVHAHNACIHCGSVHTYALQVRTAVNWRRVQQLAVEMALDRRATLALTSDGIVV